MKNISIFFLFLTQTVIAQTYELNSSLSSIAWTGKAAFSTYALSGDFKSFNGQIEQLENEKIIAKISVDMTSLHADNKDLEKHLKSKDFFHVKKFETAIFNLTKMTKVADENAIIHGDMQIKDKVNPVSFECQFMESKQNIEIQGTLILDRTKFDVIYNSPSIFKNLKDQAIEDKFELEVKLLFEKR